MKRTLIFLFFLIANSSFSQSIKVANIRTIEKNNAICVYFDINGSSAGDLFTISLQYSMDGGQSFGDDLSNCIGNVGRNQTGGPGKLITWEVLNSATEFVAKDVIFKVKADLQAKPLPYEPEMIFVEGGSFMMGKNQSEEEKLAKRAEDESPEHGVILSNFLISKYEITVTEYLKYCDENKKEMPHIEYQWSKKLKHPMVYVSWFDANEFCTWLSEKTKKKYRLPSEAEWEYAAKGGKSTQNFKYSGSDIAKDVSWHNKNSAGGEHSEVGLLNPNGLGIYDLTGNVWEWCSDWYSKTYYSIAPSKNPKGAANSESKVARGGSWRDPAVYNSYRHFCSPTMATTYIGFRVVCEP